MADDDLIIPGCIGAARRHLLARPPLKEGHARSPRAAGRNGIRIARLHRRLRASEATRRFRWNDQVVIGHFLGKDQCEDIVLM